MADKIDTEECVRQPSHKKRRTLRSSSRTEDDRPPGGNDDGEGPSSSSPVPGRAPKTSASVTIRPANGHDLFSIADCVADGQYGDIVCMSALVQLALSRVEECMRESNLDGRDLAAAGTVCTASATLRTLALRYAPDEIGFDMLLAALDDAAFGDDAPRSWTVAVDGSTIVGVAARSASNASKNSFVVRQDDNRRSSTGLITHLYVRQGRRREGIATALVEHARGEIGTGEIGVGEVADSRKAVGFWKSVSGSVVFH
jgi:GNAT superfamily N-acetyltransferase